MYLMFRLRRLDVWPSTTSASARATASSGTSTPHRPRKSSSRSGSGSAPTARLSRATAGRPCRSSDLRPRTRPSAELSVERCGDPASPLRAVTDAPRRARARR
jgi:hypothetical protein